MLQDLPRHDHIGSSVFPNELISQAGAKVAGDSLQSSLTRRFGGILGRLDSHQPAKPHLPEALQKAAVVAAHFEDRRGWAHSWEACDQLDHSRNVRLKLP